MCVKEKKGGEKYGDGKKKEKSERADQTNGGVGVWFLFVLQKRMRRQTQKLWLCRKRERGSWGGVGEFLPFDCFFFGLMIADCFL